MFGLFSCDIGIDLGTANTLVHVAGQGIVINEPTVIAVDSKNNRVTAIGFEAKKMLGRTPGESRAVRPMRDGVIAEFELVEVLLQTFIKRVQKYPLFLVKPRVVIGVPSGITEVEKRAVVKKDSEIAKYAIQYFTQLLELIKKEYGQGKNISFQIENECFNRFGHKRLLMSNEYLVEIATILHEYFPKNNLMMDSSARKDLRKLMHLFDIFVDNKLFEWKQLTLGINYYSMIPEMKPFFKRIEALSFYLPWSMPLSTLKRYQEEKGFGLEISEAQFEPWGEMTLPGNSVEELRYVVKHGLKIFPDNYKERMIRLWGMEEFGLKMKEKRLTSEHRDIIKEFFC